MDKPSYLWSAAFALPFLLTVWSNLSHKLRRPPLPPGPKRDFLLGNLRNFPANQWYDKFSEWQKTHGEPLAISRSDSDRCWEGRRPNLRQYPWKPNVDHQFPSNGRRFVLQTLSYLLGSSCAHDEQPVRLPTTLTIITNSSDSMGWDWNVRFYYHYTSFWPDF